MDNYCHIPDLVQPFSYVEVFIFSMCCQIFKFSFSIMMCLQILKRKGMIRFKGVPCPDLATC